MTEGVFAEVSNGEARDGGFEAQLLAETIQERRGYGTDGGHDQ
jgi:hypothetical protein